LPAVAIELLRDLTQTLALENQLPPSPGRGGRQILNVLRCTQASGRNHETLSGRNDQRPHLRAAAVRIAALGIAVRCSISLRNSLRQHRDPSFEHCQCSLLRSHVDVELGPHGTEYGAPRMNLKGPSRIMRDFKER